MVSVLRGEDEAGFSPRGLPAVDEHPDGGLWGEGRIAGVGGRHRDVVGRLPRVSGQTGFRADHAGRRLHVEEPWSERYRPRSERYRPRSEWYRPRSERYRPRSAWPKHNTQSVTLRIH